MLVYWAWLDYHPAFAGPPSGNRHYELEQEVLSGGDRTLVVHVRYEIYRDQCPRQVHWQVRDGKWRSVASYPGSTRGQGPGHRDRKIELLLPPLDAGEYALRLKLLWQCNPLRDYHVIWPELPFRVVG